jgi:ubiquinone/menaquinone biosynthesis C-methylase UbiE
MRKLPCEDESFDCLFCIAALQHLPSENDRLEALGKFRRVVKTGGKIIMLNWNLYSEWAKAKYGPGVNGDFYIDWKGGDGENYGQRYYHGFTLPELSQLLVKSGLQEITQQYMYNGEKSEIAKAKNILTVCAK